MNHFDCLNERGFSLSVRLAQLEYGSIRLPISPGFAKRFRGAIYVVSGILVLFVTAAEWRTALAFGAFGRGLGGGLRV